MAYSFVPPHITSKMTLHYVKGQNNELKNNNINLFILHPFTSDYIGTGQMFMKI